MTTKDAIRHLQKALTEDKGYRQSWVKNIAFAVSDDVDADYATATEVAEHFLVLFCTDFGATHATS